MEKLSLEGKSSLLSSLSKLLGKKKELQDLELTVRTQGNGRRCREHGGGGAVGGSHRPGRRWPVARGVGSGCLLQGWSSAPLPGCQGRHCALCPFGDGQTVQIPRLPPDRQRWAAGQQNLLLEGGWTFPFQSPRLRDQGTQESNTFQDLIS